MRNLKEMMAEHSYRGWRDGKVTLYEWLMGTKELNQHISKGLRHNTRKHVVFCKLAIMICVVVLGCLFPVRFTMQSPMNNVIWIFGLTLFCGYLVIKMWVMKIEMYELSVEKYEAVRKMKSLKEYRKLWKRERESNKKAWNHIRRTNREGWLFLNVLSAFMITVLIGSAVFFMAELLDQSPITSYALEEFTYGLLWMTGVSASSGCVLVTYALDQARREIGLPIKR